MVYAALGGNLLIAVTKFAAAMFTGSSAMLSEGVHSLVDTTNEALLLYGMRRSELPADDLHPLGHGREFYFWSFIVALLVFALGAGVSFYEGLAHVLRPEPIENAIVSYIVLAAAFGAPAAHVRLAAAIGASCPDRQTSPRRRRAQPGQAQSRCSRSPT